MESLIVDHPLAAARLTTMRDETTVQLHGYAYLEDGKTEAVTPRASTVAQPV